MPALPYRLVLDTNVLVRGLIDSESASGRVVKACDQRLLILLLSKPVLSEYRAVLNAPAITNRYPELTARKVEFALRRLRYVGEVITPVRANFDFPRDPKDAMWIELAIAAKATHIVSVDRDLLDLSGGRDEASRRFRQRLPSLRILTPSDFFRGYLSVK